MKCEICNQVCDGLKGISIHLKKKHKYSDLDLKKYYDKYFKKENEGVCVFCGKESIFFNLTKGYHNICDSKLCLGKTRATGTYEFLMYKYNLSKEDALKMQQERADFRGEKIKGTFDKLYDNDKYFHKKRSHNTKEFWLNKGYTEEESNKKVREVMNMIHEKTFKKFKDNPEKYDDIRTSQLKYWLKKGYNYKEAKEKLKERQKTFTLEKCINKHGIEKGTEIYNNRQQKWSNIMEQKYINGEYVKVSRSKYSKDEYKLMQIIINEMNLKENEYHSINNKSIYFRNINKKTYSYDFVYENKIIEFNGDYWHCNPVKYNENYFHKHRKMAAKEIWNYDKQKIKDTNSINYNILVIWETDYKQNPEKIIQECIDFLKS